VEFIRSQVEPEISDKRGSSYDMYGATETVRNYKDGFGNFLPRDPEENAAYRVSLIGA